MKPRKQIAALPVRFNKNGKLRILMVTSRDTGRWVMPKGWPMDGKKPWRAAEIEAMEEAGVLGTMSKEELGTYVYKKRLFNEKSVECRVTLYPMNVEKLLRRWPERHERRRKWFSPKGAAKAVREPQLQVLLKGLADKKVRKPVVRFMKQAA